MKKVTIISGKGGTGKTSLTASFAALAANRAVLVDGDVDAANLSLITGPTRIEEHQFKASKTAKILAGQCEKCSLCIELCRFGAISETYSIDPVACEGCGFCYHACPHGAIEMTEKLSGHWFVSDTPYGSLVHARLGIAEDNSGKLVTIIRNKGEALVESNQKDYLLIDGPPGIGCPVIASLSGVDHALIVTEPTVSGIHDLERILSVCRHFKVTASVCINRYDLAEEQSAEIKSYCRREDIVLSGVIPYNKAFVKAMMQGIPVVEYENGSLTEKISKIWESVAGS